MVFNSTISTESWSFQGFALGRFSETGKIVSDSPCVLDMGQNSAQGDLFSHGVQYEHNTNSRKHCTIFLPGISYRTSVHGTPL